LPVPPIPAHTVNGALASSVGHYNECAGIGVKQCIKEVAVRVPTRSSNTASARTTARASGAAIVYGQRKPVFEPPITVSADILRLTLEPYIVVVPIIYKL
jgi:hypothetical protein